MAGSHGACDLRHRARRSPLDSRVERALEIPVMEYTRLGETGVTVSRICLGCMSYGSSEWRPWVLDEAAAKPFFAKAIEAGINFFDTAEHVLARPRAKR